MAWIENYLRRPSRYPARYVILIVIALLIISVFVFADAKPVDFVTSFYPAGRYLLSGQDVFASDYTDPRDGTQHPPYNPIWILYAAVPLSVFPVNQAGVLRFLFDLASIPLLAYLSARWAGLAGIGRAILLVFAPWLTIYLYAGQWAGLALIGAILCFWGVRRSNAWILASGILLALARPNMTELLILAAILFAWRARIFFKTIVILFFAIAIFSLQQPWWMLGLLRLYYERFIHPRPADSILLLPGWPWAQFALLAVGLTLLLMYLIRSRDAQPTVGFWCLLICVGFVSALHSYTYDWVILMLPLGWLVREPRAIFLVIALYLYPFVWILLLSVSIPAPSPAIIPGVILLSVFARASSSLKTKVSFN